MLWNCRNIEFIADCGKTLHLIKIFNISIIKRWNIAWKESNYYKIEDMIQLELQLLIKIITLLLPNMRVTLKIKLIAFKS